MTENNVLKESAIAEKSLPAERTTKIMGIVNVTPDSFSDGGAHMDAEEAAEYAFKIAACGADMIDIGGESSRPGAEPVSAEEELKRVLPVLELLKGKLNIPVAVDTYKSEVAERVLEKGATYINDITALRGDKNMAKVIADHRAGVVLMHMKGSPKTMQYDPHYDDIIEEINAFFTASICTAEKAGIDPDKIIIDPGIGFGKKLGHNLEILRNIHDFKSFAKPVLIGLSRKSFIGEITGKSVDKRIFGTAAAISFCVFKGADIVRVHDVEEMADVVKIIDAIKG